MAESVRSRRRYDASRRRHQAALTRQRILEIAEREFLARGYAGVSIGDIAREADVSIQSVYASFGNKRNLLLELIRTRVAGDDLPLSVPEREWHRDMLADPDSRRLLRRFAHHSRSIGERVVPMSIVIRQAAGTDPELAADYQANRSRRYQEQSSITKELARRRALRRGLTATTAADILWTLSGPETYEALVLERHWASQTYERWLGDTLIASLLRAPDDG